MKLLSTLLFFYNDINSVQLLIKHGVDVNKRAIGDVFPSRCSQDEIKSGRRKIYFHRNRTLEKPVSLKNVNPESKLQVYFGFCLYDVYLS